MDRDELTLPAPPPRSVEVPLTPAPLPFLPSNHVTAASNRQRLLYSIPDQAIHSHRLKPVQLKERYVDSRIPCGLDRGHSQMKMRAYPYFFSTPFIVNDKNLQV
jgi:hypothetical protein